MPQNTYTERDATVDASNSAAAETGRNAGNAAKAAARALQRANAVDSTSPAANRASRDNIV